MTTVQDIVAKLWSLCDVLRDDGITFHQYVNELSYLLFLKMAEETKTERLLLKSCRWRDLVQRSHDPNEQYRHYLHMLDDLGTRGRGRVKQIFANPTTFLHHPENLNTLVSQIDSIEWHAVNREGLGDIYEGVLQKNANEKKSGAGQYFTPRPLIECIINLVKPQPGETILDPAVGTCGFFILANAYLKNQTAAPLGGSSDTAEKKQFFGVELVRDTHRLALMNAMLHSIEGGIVLGDSLAEDGVALPKADLIITNPPFGSKKGAGRSMRSELPFPTSNKQLAFLQLIYCGLKPGGRAAVVLPDNVLFEEGTGAKIRADLLDKCNLHTLLRLPTGIFYAQGVKTNVLFFTRGTKQTGNTKRIWIYDLRANMPSFGKQTPLTHEHFAEFEKCFGKRFDGTSKRKDQGESGRFRSFNASEIAQRNYRLDITWMKDESLESSDELRDPLELANEVVGELETIIGDLREIVSLIEEEEGGKA